MSIKVALEHRTSYRFDRPIRVFPHEVRLRPAPHCRTPISAYSLKVTPGEHFVNWQQDAFGNHLARFVFPEPVTELEFVVDLVADLTVINPFDFFVEEYAEHYPFDYLPLQRADLEPYLRRVDEEESRPGSGPGPLLAAWLAELRADPEASRGKVVDFLVGLNQRVQRSIAYSVRLEPGVQSPDTTLDKAVGSCRDTAWLLVAALRELGLAARFVSGYLVQLTPDVTPVEGPPGPSADFTDLHAWAEVYVPGAGWVGLDPTSGLFAGEGHIPLSATPHPSSAAPVTGSVEPCEVVFEHANLVHRIAQAPRVTLPYTAEQWTAIDALGAAVDRGLAEADVRLTMGGEPTFVAVDEMDAPEWNTLADGRGKRERAGRLAERLLREWAPGAVVTHGQGKWYPGEPLPRWQTTLVWRVDGEPLWPAPELLDHPWRPASLPPGSPAAAQAAADLAAGVARRLGVPADVLLPAHEDRLHRLWQEALLPEGEPPAVDVDPEDPAAADRRARERLLAELDADDGRPVGWVLPLFRDPDGSGWATARWTFRRGRLVLLPGDSPLGLRLPLSAVAWTAPPVVPEHSGFAAARPLPGAPAAAVVQPRVAPVGVDPAGVAPAGAGTDSADPAASVTAARLLDVDGAPRSALCVEEREGHLYVFLPPLDEFADAVELVQAIAGAAAELGVPVVLEGYPLPGHPQTRSASLTPDPGVLEVNVPPATDWPELCRITDELYREARHCGLGTEKFDLDGTHTGTGGGNHITLGGPTPADSPLLRRPDLLRSMVGYWQRHPSLSYLFSGRFIGPTSQAPRVDEARPESLYELEIAFAELDRLAGLRDADGEPVPPRPWLVDRLLRHLLTDLTGNTHRAEFCIDKLYSPDGERGRLGLLELRGFEMPPHARMAAVQQLLVRALVLRFWTDPYREPLLRWGTELHDRFLLPALVARDIGEVVDDLREHGIDFRHSWLQPFLEFRFPVIGQVELDGVRLELRAAIEPWHVLGEEATAGGTSRYVDSSVERLQVLATGLVDGRHAVTCNGREVPLTPLGATAGAGAVGGVRYRAWAPPSALHPTIGVHSPLVFDLVDRWNGRSLGGCTYHVVHPGGRSYDRFPVNAEEAQARRAARFAAAGHTAGRLAVPPSPWPGARGAGEYPRTLDLRRSGTISG